MLQLLLCNLVTYAASPSKQQDSIFDLSDDEEQNYSFWIQLPEPLSPLSPDNKDSVRQS